MKSRIYIVTTPTSKHLVEAANKLAAIRHVAMKGITAEVGQGRALIEMMQGGAELEVAASESAASEGEQAPLGV